MSAIVFENGYRYFTRDGRSFPALDGVHLTVADKEFVALVGPAGCGRLPACGSRQRCRPRGV